MYDCNLTDADHTMIRDYEWFNQKWDQVKNHDPIDESKKLGIALRQGLSINVADLDQHQSRFFKTVYINPPRPLVGYDEIKHLSAV